MSTKYIVMKTRVKKLIRKSNRRVAVRTAFVTLVLISLVYVYSLHTVFIRLNEVTDSYVKLQQKEAEYVHVVDSVKNKYNILYASLGGLHELNWENIDFWLDYYNVYNKNGVKSQIFVETGNLRSRICLEENNLVGMHYATGRETVADTWFKADGGRVSSYDFWWKSLEDYALWQKYFGFNYEVSTEEYFSLLEDHGYAASSSYKGALVYVHNNVILKNEI